MFACRTPWMRYIEAVTDFCVHFVKNDNKDLTKVPLFIFDLFFAIAKQQRDVLLTHWYGDIPMR